MNCATRLVEIFGSQAEVARAFRLDRAVVNNWVKSGYVPARWAMEVEHVTEGKIAAVEVLNEAHAVNDAVKSPEVVERMAGIGMEPAGTTPEQYERLLREIGRASCRERV